MKFDDYVQAPRLMVLRAEALQAYASVEYALGMAVHILMDVSAENALSLIQRMSNTRSRYALIEDLFDQAKFKEARIFWGKVAKELRKLDSLRNNIVHWNYVSHEPDGEPITHLLMSFKSLHSENKTSLSVDDLEMFIRDAHTASSLISFLASYKLSDQDTREALHEIFLQPVDGQTLEALMQMALLSAERNSQPQSSEA